MEDNDTSSSMIAAKAHSGKSFSLAEPHEPVRADLAC
jgi:hypothetical protein